MLDQTDQKYLARYKEVAKNKANGATFTPSALADFVAENIVGTLGSSLNDSTLRVLDPAIGDGALLFSLLEKLNLAAHDKVKIFGFDTDKDSIALTESRLTRHHPNVVLNLSCSDFLQFVVENFAYEDDSDLFKNEPGEYFDVIIANPPYVRTQILGAEQAQSLANVFGLTGRVDLYHAFLLGMRRVLKPGGIAGIIVSNRFMTTKSGSVVRRELLSHFDIVHVWDFGDTKLFNAAVLPAVLLLKKKPHQNHSNKAVSNYSSIYSTTSQEDSYADNPVDAIKMDGVVKVKDGRNFCVQRGTLECGENRDDVWRVSTMKSQEWIKTVNSYTWELFCDVGKIRVGVKTTADRIFVRSDWESLCGDKKPELLRPLTTHHMAQNYRALQLPNPSQILYPHEIVNGKRAPVDLDKYPNALEYLNKHREALESRSYVINAGRKWYEIWVPQDPLLWDEPKIIFRDIVEHPVFWMDREGTVVNGDCYWMVRKKDVKEELLWLILAVGNSSFIEKFYDHKFNNKLYASRRRFMTQYVEQFPLPDPSNKLGKALISMAKKIYSLIPSKETNALEKELNESVWKAFGLSVEEIGR